MKDKKYVFRLPIGDWSGDGHGVSRDYRIRSNKPVEAVREAYFAAEQKTRLDLTEVCGKYEEREIKPHLLAAIRAAGLPLPEENLDGFGPDEFVELTLAYLRAGDPELELKVLPFEEMLPFYGYDSKKRHIGFLGYGLMG